MKKVLVIGANGLLGSAISNALQHGYEVIEASRSHAENPVDIAYPESLQSLFHKVGKVDGIICTAGLVHFRGFKEASDADWQHGLANKLMGQVHVVRLGAQHLQPGGAIVLTTGVLAQYPMPGSSIVTTVNAAVEAFVKAAALELNGQVRVNAVSPGWISETLASMGMDTVAGLPAAEVAKAYQSLLENDSTGAVHVAAKGT